MADDLRSAMALGFQRIDDAFSQIAAADGVQPNEPSDQYLSEPGNIDLTQRPIHWNGDGSYSTVQTSTHSFDMPDGTQRYVNVPSIDNETGEPLSESDALRQYMDSGRHLGIYTNEDAAVQAAQQLSRDQAAYYDPIVEDVIARGDRSGDWNQYFPQHLDDYLTQNPPTLLDVQIQNTLLDAMRRAYLAGRRDR